MTDKLAPEGAPLTKLRMTAWVQNDREYVGSSHEVYLASEVDGVLAAKDERIGYYLRELQALGQKVAGQAVGSAVGSTFFIDTEHCEICAPQEQRAERHRCPRHAKEPT